MKDLVLHYLVPTWKKFSVALFARNLGWFWEENALTIQKRLTILSACTLSWYTRTWLSTITLATRRPIAALLSFQSSKLETLELLDSILTVRPSVTYNSENCSKIFFLVFTLTWETRVVTKKSYYHSVSLILFWCLEKHPTVISNLCDLTTQVEIPFYRGIVRQLGRGLGPLAQLIRKTVIPFLRIFIVPAAKRVDVDLL